MKKRLLNENLQLTILSFSVCGFLKKAFCLFVLFFASIVYANNVTISNVSIQANSEVDGTAFTHDYKFVQFDIAWENSWRISTGPTNWDACWVFIKYKKTPETIWKHATLSAVEAQHVPAANGVIKPTSDGKGVFVYRSSNMVQGSVSYVQTNVRWNIAADGLLETDGVEICVYAIEMVYVPQGSFYLGDGRVNTAFTERQRSFSIYNSNDPYLITSENELKLGGTDLNSLDNHNNGGSAIATTGNPDDFNHANEKILPEAFPKGFNAFYCMKYEATQYQYVEFLNKLTRQQQNNRTETALAAGTTSVTNIYVMSNRSALDAVTPIHRNGIRCNTTIHTSDPIVFYCDMNQNGVANEVDDGLDIPANRLTWSDEAAYLDWAGLRPMTEFEYEKACRGPESQYPVIAEYAWGTTSRTFPTVIDSEKLEDKQTGNERPKNIDANVIHNSSDVGPVRVGSFGSEGAGANTRERTGSSYYGIMELSGNVTERIITVGRQAGRDYDGQHGDGLLIGTAGTTNGNANVSNWPAVGTAVGTGRRGGAFNDAAENPLMVSRRLLAANQSTTRLQSNGIRGVRTAP